MGVNDLRQALLRHQLLFIDPNIILYLLDNHPRYGDLAAAVLDLIEKGQVPGITSVITLAEVLTKPSRLGNLRAMQDYELYISNFPNLTIAPIDIHVARVAAQLRGEYASKMPDALQLATARHANADGIVTNDKDWRGKTGLAALVLLNDFL